MSTSDSAGTPVSPARSPYIGYETWKGWTKPFTFAAEELEYFSGEFTDIPIAGKRVLEIGFGSGSFLAWAKTAGAVDLAGTEINPVLVQAARQHGIDVLDADLTATATHKCECFDVVVALDVFEHLKREEVDAGLHAVEAMLRPGGYLVLRFPNGQSPFGLVPQHGDVTHRTALSRSIIEQLCHDMPLTVVRYRGSYRIHGPIGMKRIVRGLRGVARDLLGGVLNAVYACNVPWDSVVVLVLRKEWGRFAGACSA